MSKVLVSKVKLVLPAGAATAAPPVGTVLGQRKVNIGAFVKSFNDLTQAMKGNLVNVVISIYSDLSFEIGIKGVPTSSIIKSIFQIKSGSSEPGKKNIKSIKLSELKSIAADKVQFLNTSSIDAAMKTIAGTARSMGLDVVNDV